VEAVVEIGDNFRVEGSWTVELGPEADRSVGAELVQLQTGDADSFDASVVDDIDADISFSDIHFFSAKSMDCNYVGNSSLLC